MPGKNLIDEIKQEELNQLIRNFSKVIENSQLLEQAKNEADILQLTINNPEINLQKMSTNVTYIMPDYLKNSKDNNHKQQKKEINLFINSFENICQQINDCIGKAYESLNNLKNPALELRNEIYKILKDFHDTKKNLCAPFLYKNNGLNNINFNNLSERDRKIFDEVNKKVSEFIEEANKLNLHYFNVFKPILEEIKNICSSIELIPNPINKLKETIEDLKSRFENILETINDKRNNVHSEFLEIKDLFSTSKKDKHFIVEKMKKEISQLKLKNESKVIIVANIKQEMEEVIKSLIEKSELIKEEIRKLNPEVGDYQSMVLKLIDVEPASEKIMKICNQVPVEAKVISEKLKDTKYEEKLIKETSLDLLYLMDITGSMEAYVDNTKKELINMMNKIIDRFNGIDINLGFIGYKDLEEHSNNNFIDEDFTKKYENIKNCIEKVEIGGGGDIAEDIAWAFERALNKNWAANARFAILAGDAPCHGLKYHGHEDYDDFPDGIPERKDIEESIKELCDKNICLLCIKITERTDIMYDIFKDIYTQNNKASNFFIGELSKPENLSKIIIEKCEKVYEEKRFESK